jgi:hypothetical protein
MAISFHTVQIVHTPQVHLCPGRVQSMYILQVFPEFASILRVFIPIRQKLKSSERIHQPGQIICPLIRKLPRNQTPAPVFPESSRRIHARPVIELQHILHLENGNARD